MWLDNRMDSICPFLLGRRQLVVLSMLSLVPYISTAPRTSCLRSSAKAQCISSVAKADVLLACLDANGQAAPSPCNPANIGLLSLPPPQATSSPGAGQYDHYGAIGKHASSQQPNAASGVLGCVTRDQMSKASCCASYDCCLGLHSEGNRRSLHSTAARWSYSQTPVSGSASWAFPAAAPQPLGSHTQELACFQGVCLVRCSGCHFVTLTTQGRQLLCLILMKHCSSGVQCNSHCSRLHSASNNSTSSNCGSSLGLARS